MADLRFAVAVEAANVRLTPGTGAEAVGTLRRGDAVVPAEGTTGAERWIRFRHEGREAYVSRRVLTQTSGAPADLAQDVLAKVNERLVAVSNAYDGIGYKLGCKAVPRADGIAFPAGQGCTGRTVDCSGWVAAALAHAAGAVIDGARGAVASLLANHSDGQIVAAGRKSGFLVSGAAVRQVTLRPGLIFGLNHGDYDWEGAGRIFGIDHIVVGMETRNGYAVSQSSSSGGGVNVVPWETWSAGLSRLFDENRIHCTDVLSAVAGSLRRTRGQRAAAPEDVERILRAAPAG